MCGNLTRLVRTFWADDAGAIVSAEYALVGGVLVTGVVPGLVAARNSVNAAYGSMGNRLQAAVPDVSYSGYSISGENGNAIASVGGVSMNTSQLQQYLQAAQNAPLP